MKREVIWFALLFLVNVIFITIAITYVQTTVYSNFRNVEEKLNEIEYKISAIHLQITQEEILMETTINNPPPTIPTIHTPIEIDTSNLTISEAIIVTIKQEFNILNELYEYIIDITRTVHEVNEGVLVIGQEANNLRREFSLFNENNENSQEHLSLTSNPPKVSPTSNGGDCSQIEINYEEFNPIKRNFYSFFANAHKVIKTNPDWRTFDGEITNGLLKGFTRQFYNMSITSFSRVDAYYLGDAIYPSGFSFFFDVIVDQYYEKITNPYVTDFVKQTIENSGNPVDKGDRMFICSKCKLIIHANMHADFNTTHTSNNEHIAASISSGSNLPLDIQHSNMKVFVYNPSVRVNFITTVYNVAIEFHRIMGYLEKVYDKDSNIRWIITDFQSNDTDVQDALKKSKIPHLYIPMEGKFNKIKGLNDATENVNSDEILFFLDVDMYFENDFSHIIRSRVSQGEQVFYPICYSFYSNGSPPEYKNGYYREGGLGNVGMYKSDFELNRWSKNGNQEVWGQEDNAMFDKLSKKYITYRTYEPQFFHLYHNQRSWHPAT